MKLTVVLGASSEASFDIDLFDTPFVKKWLKELRWCLTNCEFNQQEAFAGFLTPDESAQRLFSACVVINRYMKNFIEIKPDLLSQSQEYFNYLHEQFERLSGEFGKPTRLFTLANDELKNAIRDLNFYIHSTEKKFTTKNFYISFNKDRYKRIPFQQEDYDDFVFNIEPGTLILHYVELGKNYFNIFKDKLQLDYPALKTLHFYSGEATLSFQDFSIDHNNFKSWMINHNIDPTNKFLGHGQIRLGEVKNKTEVLKKLENNKFIKNIIITDE